MHGAIPQVYFEPNSSVPAAEMATHILDHLYKKLNEVCHMQGGEVVTAFLALGFVLCLNSCGSLALLISINLSC